MQYRHEPFTKMTENTHMQIQQSEVTDCGAVTNKKVMHFSKGQKLSVHVQEALLCQDL